YDQALALNPQDGVAHYNRGLSFSALGKNAEACHAYGEAIRFKPDLLPVYIDQGDAYAALGQYKLALATYEQVLARKPDYLNAHLAKAYALYKEAKEEPLPFSLQTKERALAAYRKV